MRVLKLSATVALWIGTASAFYPYIMEGHHGAKHRVHTGDAVSKGLTFTEGSSESKRGLVKMHLQRRARPKRRSTKLAKRVNDFEIAAAQDTTDANSAPIDQDGTDFSYFTEVHLGTDPGETVYLLLDTGSSSMWVMGTDCISTACTTHSTFGASDSKSYQDSSETFDIGYNTGEVAGDIVTDTVAFAGISVEMQFGVARITSDDFDNYPMDGILGLGRSSEGSGLDAPTFMQTVMKEKDLGANVFGINLSRSSDGENDGQITFGGVDDDRIDGDINYIPTTGDVRDWMIPVDNIRVDGQDAGVASGRTAIIDTGTTYSFIAADDARNLYGKIQGAAESDNGVYHVPCDTTTSVALVFGGVAYEISPKDYVGREVGDGQCYTHIIAQNAVDEQGTWLLGGTFLKNVYSVFDLDQSRIGFAKKAAEGASGSSSSAPATSSTSSSSSSESSSSESSSSDSSSSDSSSSSTGSSAETTASANSSSESSTTPETSSDAPSSEMPPEPSGLARPTSGSDGSGSAPPATETAAPSGASDQEGAAGILKVPGLCLFLGALAAFVL